MSESSRFDALLAKLSPSILLKKLEEELNGIDGKPGLAHQLIDAVTNARVLEDLARRKRESFQSRPVADYSAAVTEQARLEMQQATYAAVSLLMVAETLSAEVERVTDAIEQSRPKSR